MNAISFDTLRFAKRLQAAGYTPEQAEAQAEAYAEATAELLVTKPDLELAKHELQQSIFEVKHELQQSVSEVKQSISEVDAHIETSAANLRAEFREGNLNLIKWIVPMLIGQTAVVAALVKLF